VIAGYAPFAEVVVAMHDWVSDERIAVHRGTRVRKCHTSRRDAFKSVNGSPIAYYDIARRALQVTGQGCKERHKRADWVVHSQFDPNVALVKFHPGMSVEMIDWATTHGYRGIVMEGTGLGHVGEALFPALEKATRDGIVVAMCSQCIWGRVHMNVYSTGRDLQKIGVIPLGDMLSETALAKMMWAFGQEKDSEDVKKLMMSNIVNEFSERRTAEGR
jgi:glutamyl-tRNA(Gln) amidotransferase subunit D